TGSRSCFPPPPVGFDLARLEAIVTTRASADPADSYTARLLASGSRRAAEKVVEEAGEVAGAALAGTDAEVRDEAADLLYHLLVLLASRGVTLSQVEAVLAERHPAERHLADG
ncbi:MAG TPA: phosphoribosyl-ATP diphosphatase, partial [Candidatus Limnocylindria bacterium]|nr:phosphoribosyl-ATP diphosphatase [Candidatus Limnocylindria bacterium]